MSSKTEVLLRSEFAKLSKQREDILAVSGPLREARDKVQNEARDRVNAMNAKIKEVEKDLYQVDTEIAQLARALGGRTMSNTSK